MGRITRDANIATKSARARCTPRNKPYFRQLDAEIHIGYRRGQRRSTWVARRYIGGGEYRQETLGLADDVQDADGEHVLNFQQACEKARREHQKAQQAQDIRSGPFTVRDAVEAHISRLEKEGRSSENTRTRAEASILPELGNVDVAQLTTRQIRQWLERQAERPARRRTAKGEEPRYREDDSTEAARRRRSSANRELTVLKAALNQAWRDGRVATDEAWRRVQPFQRADAARIRYLDSAECTRLLNACEPDLRTLVRGALLTGMRFGELAACRVRDLDRDAGAVFVAASKSGRARYVYLNDEGLRFFCEITAGRPKDAFMFQRAAGDPWRKNTYQRPLRVACERAGIDPPATFHVLRHTYASHMLMAGAPQMVVAENLGHSDTRMIEKHYGHLCRTFVADTIRRTAPSFGLDEPDVERLDDHRSSA